MKNLNNKISKNIPWDYVYTFINNLNMSDSVWVLYLAFRGMSLMQIGILEGIFHITGMLFEIPSGAFADLLGRRKSLIIGRVCIAVSCIIMMLSASFGGFAFAFVLQALGHNFNSGSEEALVYDSLKQLGDEERYMKINSRLNVLMEISQAIATVTGGILAEYSYMWCYGACVAIAVLGVVPALFMVEPMVSGASDVGAKRERIGKIIIHHFDTSVRILRSDKRICKIVFYYSAVFAAYTMLFFYSQQYFVLLGFNKIQIGVVMLLAGGVACVGAVCSTWLYERFGTWLANIGAAVIALSIASFGFNNLVVSMVVFFVAGFFNSTLYPVQSSSLNALIPSEQRATLISVNSMVFSIAMILIFPITGAFADRFGLDAAFAGLGIILFVAVLLTRRTVKP